MIFDAFFVFFLLPNFPRGTIHSDCNERERQNLETSGSGPSMQGCILTRSRHKERTFDSPAFSANRTLMSASAGVTLLGVFRLTSAGGAGVGASEGPYLTIHWPDYSK